MVCESDPTHPISLAEEAVLHPLVPTSLLQDIERKLEADLSTIAITIVFAMGFICLGARAAEGGQLREGV